MYQWFMLTLVGRDQPGIVARVTNTLYEHGCHLGEASMLRLGGNFTIMLMVRCTGDAKGVLLPLKPVMEALHLQIHVDKIDAALHQHQDPDVRVSVHGADRPGIVAQVTQALAAAGLNIIGLESDVGGNEYHPFYVMTIEGIATQGIEVLEKALSQLLNSQPDLNVQIEPLDNPTL